MESNDRQDSNETSANEMSYESSQSHHSFEKFELLTTKFADYTTTNLITKANQTLADIKVQFLKKSDITERINFFIRKQGLI